MAPEISLDLKELIVKWYNDPEDGNGIIYAIATSSERGYHKEIAGNSTTLLNTIIACTARVDVLVAVHGALREVNGLKVTRSWLLPSWELVKRRFPAARAIHSVDYIDVRACDNMQSFSRCSGCKSVYYCSEPCQRIDWLREHRTTCPLPKFGCLSWYTASTKVHASVGAQGVRGPTFAGPGIQRPLGIQVELHEIAGSELESQVERAGATKWWDSVMKRARSSGGDMEVHIVKVWEPAGARYWVVPLRRTGCFNANEGQIISSDKGCAYVKDWLASDQVCTAASASVKSESLFLSTPASSGVRPTLAERYDYGCSGQRRHNRRTSSFNSSSSVEPDFVPRL
ncbi:hypothetical protein B0H14DRAFT_2577438 [Mycena olivaceomarginata]|nr:hypothetical protein B0H14DRAFT_2577438 [Mycena olivaceomarginata]